MSPERILMIRLKSYAGSAALLAVMVCLAGCAPDGPEVVEISGVATRGGNPVPNIELTFHPDFGRPSWGVTDEQGRFELHYTRQQDGAVVGRHKVTIRGRQPQSAEEEFSGTITVPPEIAALREKFGSVETTTLVFEISEPKDNLEVSLD
jgi:hypothetical protein